MISPHQALAARRLLVAQAALGATLAAHAACAGPLRPTAAAPALWGAFSCLAILVRPGRGARWREWSAAGLVTRLVLLQAALHAGMVVAPWAFGMAPHHRAPLIGASVVAVHGVAALVLAAALRCAQRALSLAQGLVRAVRRALRPTGRVAPPPAPVAAADGPGAGVRRRRAHGARGPPAGPLLRTGGGAPRRGARDHPEVLNMHARRAIVALLAGGALAGGAVPALAHTELVATTPARGAVVRHLPATITLSFSQAAQRVSGGRVLRAGSKVNHARSARLNPRNARQVRIATRLDQVGQYTVVVRLVAPDGDPQVAVFRFRVTR